MALNIPSSNPKPKSQSPRRQARKERIRQHFHEDDSITPPTYSSTPSTPPSTPASPSSRILAMPATARLLICSIGNPSPYLGTLHSAGHTVLAALAAHLSLPPLAKSRAHGNGLLSRGGGSGDEYTLWQSPTLMNASGPAVRDAWKQFMRDHAATAAGGADGADAVPKLVVLHDELEAPLGTIVVRAGAASAKGHNGLKSIQGALGRGGDGGAQWMRIGVGIGRPTSREPEVVSAFVLRKMSGVERGKIEGVVGKVVEELGRMSSGG